MTDVRHLLVACGLCLAACAGNGPAGPTVPLDRQFTIGVGEAARIDGTALRLAFLGVSGDSRCPADAVCILGGDAIVRIRAEHAGTAGEYELHTGDASRAAVAHAGFRVELVGLQPYPFSGRAVQPGEYRATLAVTQIAR